MITKYKIEVIGGITTVISEAWYLYINTKTVVEFTFNGVTVIIDNPSLDVPKSVEKVLEAVKCGLDKVYL